MDWHELNKICFFLFELRNEIRLLTEKVPPISENELIIHPIISKCSEVKR